MLQKLLIIKLSSIEACEKSSDNINEVRQFDFSYVEKQSLEQLQLDLVTKVVKEEIQIEKNPGKIDSTTDLTCMLRDNFMASIKKATMNKISENKSEIKVDDDKVLLDKESKKKWKMLKLSATSFKPVEN